MRCLLAILLLLSAAGCAGRQVAFLPRPIGEYRNETLGIRFRVPDEKRAGETEPRYWELREGMDGAVVVALSRPSGPGDAFRENLVVFREPLEEEISAEELRRRHLERARSSPGFTLVGEGADQAGPWMEYTHQERGRRLHVLAWFRTRGQEGYLLVFSATPRSFPRYRRTFEEIARSFEFLPAPAPSAEGSPPSSFSSL